VYSGCKLIHHVRLATDRVRTHDEYGVLVRELLGERSIDLASIKAADDRRNKPPI
jgi:type III pantothenate kinase